ncbi:MAG: type IX secretion system membrane protein PorP/SprF [Bacteroidales bacterium]|nr:type IX secretion system membrane protein PorP/SprF [Bacteroidales bacterium]
MLRKTLFIAAFLPVLIAHESAQAQDAAFSQYYANPVYLNPALAGSRICPRVNLNYRNQWPSAGKSFVTYNISYDQFIEELSGGIGVIVQSDQLGEHFSRNQASLIYSYRLKLSPEVSLNAALQGGIRQHQLDWANLVFADQISLPDGTISSGSETPPENTNLFYPDFSGGFVFSRNGNTYVGAAFHHITEPNISFYTQEDIPLNLGITAHAGTLIDLGRKEIQHDEESFALSPNILYRQQGDFHQLNIGTYFNKFPFSAGLWLRHNFEQSDALIALFGLKYEKLRIGYSFDVTLSSLSGSTGGAHEVSFAWLFDCREKRSKPKAINCPEF